MLDRVTEVFWTQGYAQTSVADLVEATGVHKPSLYRTFGSKDELFALVLRRYVTAPNGRVRRTCRVDAPGHRRHPAVPGRDARRPRRRRRQSRLPARRLLLRAARHDPGFEDFGAVYRQAIRDVLRPLVAKAGGSPADVDQRTNVLATWLLGLDVTTRGGAATQELDQAIDSMGHLISNWA